MLKKYHVEGNSFIGIVATANESIAILPTIPAIDSLIPLVKETLGVEKVIQTSVDGSYLVGAFVSMNSNGAVVYPLMNESEINSIKKVLPVAILTDRYNAAGNNILVNDNGALVHPSFNDATLEMISKTLDVPAKRGTVAGFHTVGSAAVATNKAAICHPHTTEKEIEVMEEILQVEVSLCTANYGSGLLGACMMANTKGAILGEESTPIEMGKVEEGLKLY